MKYTEVVDKITKVFESCSTPAQRIFARKWCGRLIGRYFPAKIGSGDCPVIPDDRWWELQTLIDDFSLRRKDERI